MGMSGERCLTNSIGTARQLDPLFGGLVILLDMLHDRFAVVQPITKADIIKTLLQRFEPGFYFEGAFGGSDG
jgi:hypothetical protein